MVGSSQTHPMSEGDNDQAMGQYFEARLFRRFETQ